MNLRSAILTILISAATTTVIMAYQAGRLMDQVFESPLPDEPPVICQGDCICQGNCIVPDDSIITQDEHRRALDALQKIKDETLGREI